MAEMFSQQGGRGITVGPPGNMASGEGIFGGVRQALGKLNEMQQAKDQRRRERKERTKAVQGALQVAERFGVDVPDEIDEAPLAAQEAYAAQLFTHLVPKTLDQRFRREEEARQMATLKELGIDPAYAVAPQAVALREQSAMAEARRKHDHDLLEAQQEAKLEMAAKDFDARMLEIGATNAWKTYLERLRQHGRRFAPDPLDSTGYRRSNHEQLGMAYGTPEALGALVPDAMIPPLLEAPPAARGEAVQRLLPDAVRRQMGGGSGGYGLDAPPAGAQGNSLGLDFLEDY